MDETLVNQFKQILETENIVGCVVADPQGLCLLASPNIKPESAGLVSAISQYVSQIDADICDDPVICLEGTTRQCLIKTEDGITTAIFKNKIIQNGHN